MLLVHVGRCILLNVMLDAECTCVRNIFMWCRAATSSIQTARRCPIDVYTAFWDLNRTVCIRQFKNLVMMIRSYRTIRIFKTVSDVLRSASEPRTLSTGEFLKLYINKQYVPTSLIYDIILKWFSAIGRKAKKKQIKKNFAVVYLCNLKYTLCFIIKKCYVYKNIRYVYIFK